MINHCSFNITYHKEKSHGGEKPHLKPTFITCFKKNGDSGALSLLVITSSNGYTPLSLKRVVTNCHDKIAG
jgi:hypothetical protein